MLHLVGCNFGIVMAMHGHKNVRFIEIFSKLIWEENDGTHNNNLDCIGLNFRHRASSI